MSAFTAPKGTYDILPPDSAVFLATCAALAAPARRAGFGYIETPIFEDTALFHRGVGESTDVVSKEMYTFDDKGGRSLTLRPEGTAGVMRAFVEHRMHAGQLPAKLWYRGPNFRYERPQHGRYRHFTQVGAEAIGVDDPLLDAELIHLADAGFREAGLRGHTLLLNSLGDRESRAAHREALVAFLARLDLDDDTRRRAELNPLRVLDDKRATVQEQLADAPVMIDYLTAECRAHYDAVRAALADLGVAWTEEPKLVRGLDYYTKTTFEFTHPGLGSQSAVDAERPADAGHVRAADLRGQAVVAAAVERLDVFVVPIGDTARRRAVVLARDLREHELHVDLAWGGKGLKGAMRAADRSGARFALVLGDRDLATGEAQLKDLASGEQRGVPLDADGIAAAMAPDA